MNTYSVTLFDEYNFKIYVEGENKLVVFDKEGDNAYFEFTTKEGPSLAYNAILDTQRLLNLHYHLRPLIAAREDRALTKRILFDGMYLYMLVYESGLPSLVWTNLFRDWITYQHLSNNDFYEDNFVPTDIVNELVEVYKELNKGFEEDKWHICPLPDYLGSRGILIRPISMEWSLSFIYDSSYLKLIEYDEETEERKDKEHKEAIKDNTELLKNLSNPIYVGDIQEKLFDFSENRRKN